MAEIIYYALAGTAGLLLFALAAVAAAFAFVSLVYWLDEKWGNE